MCMFYFFNKKNVFFSNWLKMIFFNFNNYIIKLIFFKLIYFFKNNVRIKLNYHKFK